MTVIKSQFNTSTNETELITSYFLLSTFLGNIPASVDNKKLF